MSLPIQPNTTMDIYRAGNAPPDPPDVAGVPCHLRPDYVRGTEANEGQPAQRWTHIALIAADVDIRDHYIGAGSLMTADDVWIPDKDGTMYRVMFIERIGSGTAHDHKRVYLDRHLPPWPTDEI